MDFIAVRKLIIPLTLFLCVQCNATLKVSVYYEALCPDSINFIVRQLYPSVGYFQDFIEVELVPYGKASHHLEDGSWIFSCQHGPPECSGNKYQSCALLHTKNQTKQLQFVNCAMKLRNPTSQLGLGKCVQELRLNSSAILNCYKSTEGDNLLASNGDKTGRIQPKLSFVPTITFDGLYDEDLQMLALRDFKVAVCNKITKKPPVCKQE